MTSAGFAGAPIVATHVVNMMNVSRTRWKGFCYCSQLTPYLVGLRAYSNADSDTDNGFGSNNSDLDSDDANAGSEDLDPVSVLQFDSYVDEAPMFSSSDAESDYWVMRCFAVCAERACKTGIKHVSIYWRNTFFMFVQIVGPFHSNRKSCIRVDNDCAQDNGRINWFELRRQVERCYHN